MKKKWEIPSLEVLDVRMTMKHHGDAEEKDPEEGDDNVLDS